MDHLQFLILDKGPSPSDPCVKKGFLKPDANQQHSDTRILGYPCSSATDHFMQSYRVKQTVKGGWGGGGWDQSAGKNVSG